jgi:hypothetical protein
VRLEISDAGGEVLARETVPSPGKVNPRVELTLGTLGSAGALIEAAVAGGDIECRTLWRYRERRLSRVPLPGSSGPVPDCGPPEWKYRWERPSEDAPALLVRERSRQRGNGLFREVEGYRYAGFRMEPERGRSSSAINGVEIPGWRDVTLYPRALIESLTERFDLAGFHTEPHARLIADRAQGIFELRVEDPSQARSFPITAAVPGQGTRETLLSIGTEGARVRVFVSGDGSVPVDARVQGLGSRFDRGYLPVTRQGTSGQRVYDAAEQELAEEFLPGTWDSGKEQMAVTLLSDTLPRLRFGKSEVSVSFAQAPNGVDILLLPRDGSPPSLGLQLKGPNAFVEVPVRCAPAGSGAARPCEAGAPGQQWRRVGARVNAR